MLRCNKCHRPMQGTTAYGGACACGGLIEQVACPVCNCQPGDDPCGCACHEGKRFGVDEKGRRYDTKTGRVD